MARRLHYTYTTILLLIVIVGGKAQIFDFFQGFQPIIPYQTLKPIIRDYAQEITTKRPKSTTRRNVHTTKSPLSFEYDNPERDSDRQVMKEKKRKQTTELPVYNFNFYTTTVKPVRKTTKSPQRGSSISRVTRPKDYKATSTRLVASNQDNKRYDTPVLNNIGDDYHTPRPHHEYTRKTDTNYNSYENNFTPYNYDDLRPLYNSYTTNNPFYMPGVKPAVVDNRPPITNRPITSRPFTTRPQTSRPTPKTTTTSRPIVSYPRPTDEGAILFPDDDVGPQLISGPDEDYMTETEKRRYIDLAEKMCDKYRSLNMKKLQAIPLLPSPDPVQVTVSSCTPSNIPLVVGGKIVSIREFPHMALLGWKKIEGAGYSWKCGGSLISEQYVLTAAHCAYQERDNTVVSGPPRVVQLGSSYFDDPGALVVQVSAAIRHPKYKASRSYHDVALLKLAAPVSFSEVVKPACMGVPPPAGSPIVATGWGHTKAGGNVSQELRSVSLPIWDIDECARVLGTSRKLPDGPSGESQLCAGERRGGKDTCQGDSGGPAQIQDGCLWRVVAITSVGRSCAAPNTPGLYSLIPRAFVAAQVFGGSSATSGNTQSNIYDQNNRNPNNNYDQNNRNPNNNYDQNNRNPNNNYDYNNINQNNNYAQTNSNNRNQNNNYTSNNRDQRGSFSNHNSRATTNYDTSNNYNNQNNRNDYNSNNNNNRNANTNINRDDGQSASNKKENPGSNGNYYNVDYSNTANNQNNNQGNPYNKNDRYNSDSYGSQNRRTEYDVPSNKPNNNFNNNNNQRNNDNVYYNQASINGSQNTQQQVYNNQNNYRNNNKDYISYSSDYVAPNYSSHPFYQGRAWWAK